MASGLSPPSSSRRRAETEFGLEGFASLSCVSLIMCTGGECRGVRHDRHFKMNGSTFAENAKLSDVLEHLNET